MISARERDALATLASFGAGACAGLALIVLLGGLQRLDEIDAETLQRQAQPAPTLRAASQGEVSR